MKLYPDIGIVAPVAYYFSDKSKLWRAGDYKSGTLRLNKLYNIKRQIGQFFPIENMANAFLVRRQVMEDVGLFDNLNFPRDENEPDFYFRVRAKGYRTVMLKNAITYHDIEMGRLAHFDPERILESFKSRIWLDRKHRSKKLEYDWVIFNLYGALLFITRSNKR